MVPAGIRGGIGGANPLSSAAPPPLHFGGWLEQSRRRSLAQDLPDRFGQAPPPAAAATQEFGLPAAPVVTLAPEALTPLVQVLQNYNQGYLARMDAAATAEAERWAQEDERRAQEKVKLPSSRWGKTLPTLMKLCNVDDEVFLPTVWHDLASHGSKSDRRTLQFHMDLEYPDLGDSGKIGALVSISAALAQDLVNFRFIGHTPDLIGVGLSIFMVSYPTTDAVAALRDSVALYDQQVDGVQAVTVAEADKMHEDQKFRYPTTYLGVKQVLWSYHRLLDVVIGFNHPITQAFAPLVRRYEQRESTYAGYFNELCRCAGLLKYIHIGVYNALDAHFRNQDPPPLDFLAVFTRIDYGEWIPPVVPHAPGLTTTPEKPSAAKTSGAQQNPVNRSPAIPAHLDRALVPVIPRFSPAQYIRKYNQPPLNDQNISMCLSYHVVGYCSPSCPRAGDHRKHSAKESARLAEYLAPALKDKVP
jgi:hypothetical protein